MHRQDCHGPFDYQWSQDLYGIELYFQGEKYGECCNSEQFFADLKPFRLPQRVTEVAVIVSGVLVSCVFEAVDRSERPREIVRTLEESGLGKYRVINRG